MKKDRMNKKENKRGWKESDVRMGDWKGGGALGMEKETGVIKIRGGETKRRGGEKGRDRN